MPFPTVAGSDLLCLDAGTYDFHVQMTSGQLVKADYIRFVYEQTPVESTSWGAIKSMFR